MRGALPPPLSFKCMGSQFPTGVVTVPISNKYLIGVFWAHKMVYLFNVEQMACLGVKSIDLALPAPSARRCGSRGRLSIESRADL